MTFDYVVVGGGSAGCVLAARLSEDPNVRVLLLEAGGRDRSLRIRAPGLVALLLRSRFDWAFSTAPQEELAGRRVPWPRGKVLGGSGATNLMVYVRGHRDNYDEWRDLGNEGWGYDDVLPYFKRSENNGRGEDEFHGARGPLDVTDVDCNPLSHLFIESTHDALGAALNLDFNGVRQEGVGRYQATIRNGERCSTASAFLRPARSRTNLVVETGAQVLGLDFANGRVTGVRWRRGGVTTTTRAEREIVLSAGAVGSPHLLLLSGIGPADELRAHGIPVVADLPGVGKNLQDHLFVSMAYEDKGGLAPEFGALAAAGSLARWAMNRKGLLASTLVESGAFVRSDPSAPRPDLQLACSPLAARQIDEETFRPLRRGFTLNWVPLYPKSRGELRLTSADPTTPPTIDPKYLSDEDDMRMLLAGHRLVREIVQSKLLRRCRGEALVSRLESGDEGVVRAELRRRASTQFHPVGTCKMGNDPAAVVDAELRVRGVEGLRVVDASVMPTIIGGNTNAPTIMIAERGADLILEGRKEAGRRSAGGRS